VRAQAAALKTQWDTAATRQTKDNRRAAFSSALFAFQEELAGVAILDPACGSGNFLYVALAALLDLEKEVVAYGTSNGLSGFFPRVGPRQLYGLEINEYAHELAQVVVWIGYLQWMSANGFLGNPDPILEALETIKLQDALLDLSDPAHPKEAHWPAVDFIIGNPPFLGDKKMRKELGSKYLAEIWTVFRGRLPAQSDLVCYFFEIARSQIAGGTARRAGLLATNSIRAGANRSVLKRIKHDGDIFFAWSDQPWMLNGAAVRISIVGFDGGSETDRRLNGVPVGTINADLTSGVDVTNALRLKQDQGIAFLGIQKGGPFDVSDGIAQTWLVQPHNPNGRPNSDVVKRRLNGYDITRGSQHNWIVDFGPTMTMDEAALYEAPFEHVRLHVKPLRDVNPRKGYRDRWWLHTEPRQGLRARISNLSRYICTPSVSKYRIFVWTNHNEVPDHKLIVFARDDDYFFGVLQARPHELWSLAQISRQGVGNDPVYNALSCFETFPLPWAPGTEPVDDPRVIEIGAAAKELDDRRRAWLDPEGASAADLKKRTLTNLYNQRPTWLANAHARLDRAVWAAYGWDDPDPAVVADDVILSRLLALNLERAAAQAS